MASQPGVPDFTSKVAGLLAASLQKDRVVEVLK